VLAALVRLPVGRLAQICGLAAVSWRAPYCFICAVNGVKAQLSLYFVKLKGMKCVEKLRNREFRRR